MTIFRGYAVDGNPRLSPLGWFAALTWLSVIGYAIRVIARLLGWRHVVSIEKDDDGNLFFKERISVLEHVIADKKVPLASEARLTYFRWIQGDPRLLVMGSSFLAVSWAIGAYELISAIQGADASAAFSAVLWFIAGIVMDIVLWMVSSRIQHEVVTVYAGPVEFTAIPETDELV